MVTWPPLQRRAPVLSRSTVRCSSGNFDSLHLLWYQLQSGFQSGLRSMQPARSLFASRYWNALSQIHASSPHGWMHQLPSSAETGTRGNERFPPAQLKSVFMGRRRGARRPNEMFKNKNKTLDFHCAACKSEAQSVQKGRTQSWHSTGMEEQKQNFLCPLSLYFHLGGKPRRVHFGTDVDSENSVHSLSPCPPVWATCLSLFWFPSGRDCAPSRYFHCVLTLLRIQENVGCHPGV